MLPWGSIRGLFATSFVDFLVDIDYLVYFQAS